MKFTYKEDIQNTWKKVGRYKNPEQYELEIGIYKKMLDMFQTGEYYYFIFNPPAAEIELISDSMSQVLGYEKEEVNIDLITNIIHPDDLPYFLDFERTVVDFKLNLPSEKLTKYKTRYDYRIRKKDGNYIRILQQSVTIQSDEEGSVLRNIVVHTDISFLKKDNAMHLSFIGLEGEQSFLDVKPMQKYITSSIVPLTKREKEVLLLIVQNKTTAEIAQLLFISTHTVSTHRKKIMAKTKSSSLVDLISKCLIEGWI